ncbi:hypothetical protein [Seonamhaeicola sp.]|uniref:hypothetical protein n=1 Tax=Seonamhaeicola sp. TaxID=1912245 RepID=UPI002620C5A6|nr:hypothetical protein [Seonamhaeicola sp.]
MNLLKKWYKHLIVFVVLAPNLFVVAFGIESFPFTCAPMFGHYIDNNTNLYIFKFEGVRKGIKTDLSNYYNKPEDCFIRHFFSKVYGSAEAISPFTHKLTESPEAFNQRMNAFFEDYTAFLKKEHQMTFDRIDISVKSVDQNRNVLMDYKILGSFISSNSSYVSVYKPKNK